MFLRLVAILVCLFGDLSVFWSFGFQLFLHITPQEGAPFTASRLLNLYGVTDGCLRLVANEIKGIVYIIGFEIFN